MKHILIYIKYIQCVVTRCRPLKRRRCIADVVLRNEGSMVQTRRNVNVQVVNTDMC